MADDGFLSDLFFADHHSQARVIPLGRKPPIHNRNVGRHPLASLLEIVKFLGAKNALSRAKEKSLRFRHETAYTGVKRLRPFLRRLANMARPLRLEFRLRNPCCRFRRIFDGWYVRFISQLLIYLVEILRILLRKPTDSIFVAKAFPSSLPQRKREEKITTSQKPVKTALKKSALQGRAFAFAGQQKNRRDESRRLKPSENSSIDQSLGVSGKNSSAPYNGAHSSAGKC